LASLAKVLSSLWTDINGKLMIPPTGSPDEPELLRQSRALLVGTVLEGEDIGPLRKKIADATNISSGWIIVNKRAKNVTEDLIRLQTRTDLSDAQRSVLSSVRDQLVGVWRHLWEAQTMNDVATISANGNDLDSAEISLARIESAAEQIPPLSAFSLERALLFAAYQPTSLSAFTPLSDINHLPANDERRFDVLTRAIRYGDRGSAILAFVIALLTGLNANYFSKPFGTLQDYITLFLWAAGTKAAVDILTSVLDRFSLSFN
jgi:hypothetical protein